MVTASTGCVKILAGLNFCKGVLNYETDLGPDVASYDVNAQMSFEYYLQFIPTANRQNNQCQIALRVRYRISGARFFSLSK